MKKHYFRYSLVVLILLSLNVYLSNCSNEVKEPHFYKYLPYYYQPTLSNMDSKFPGGEVIAFTDIYVKKEFVKPSNFKVSKALSDSKVVEQKPLPKEKKDYSQAEIELRDCSAYIDFKIRQAPKVYDTWGSKMFLFVLLRDKIVNQLFCLTSDQFEAIVKKNAKPVKSLSIEDLTKYKRKVELGERQPFNFKIKNVSDSPVQNVLVLFFLPKELDIIGEPEQGMEDITIEKKNKKKKKIRKRRVRGRKRGDSDYTYWSYTVFENNDKQKVIAYFAEFTFEPKKETTFNFDTIKVIE